MSQNKKIQQYRLLFVVAIGALGATFYVVSHNVNGISTKVVAGPTVAVVDLNASYPSDFSDNRNLVGASHDIFVGKIIDKIGSEGWYTKFAVQVVDDIKGNLQGTVTVGVTGGYYNGVFYVARGSTWLAPGSTYLLAVRYRSIDDSYRLIDFDDPVSWELLSNDTTLSTTQLQAIAANDSRVKQLQAAYPNEILDKADIYNHETFNSYISTHPILPAPPPPPPAAPSSTPSAATSTESLTASTSSATSTSSTSTPI